MRNAPAVGRMFHLSLITAFYYLSLNPEPLDTNVLAAHVDHLIDPVVLHRVVVLGTLLSVLPDGGADALVDPARIPGEVVHHPEVLPLVVDHRTDVPDHRLQLKVLPKRPSLQHVIHLECDAVQTQKKIDQKIIKKKVRKLNWVAEPELSSSPSN